MEVPEDWTNNPMLEPTPDDPDHKGHEDAGINHDHYVYGSPKKWMKVDGEWVEVQCPTTEEKKITESVRMSYRSRRSRLDEPR